MSGDDRRQQPRVPVRTEAEVRFASWEIFKLIYTVNISQGGMNLEVGEAPKEGSVIRVKLALPSGPPIELEATVKHVREVTSQKPLPPSAPPQKKKFQVGVQFVNLDAKKKQSIELTIRAHAGALSATVGLKKKDP